MPDISMDLKRRLGTLQFITHLPIDFCILYEKYVQYPEERYTGDSLKSTGSKLLCP
jgi:hypothetical protein